MSANSSFMRLVSLVRPPDYPVRAYGDWKRFTSVNGFPPPEDYRMLIREYGAGRFGGWIDLIEPFNPSWTFIEKAEVECEALRRSMSRAPEPAPGWSIWPEPGGMLPWATTASGDHIGWKAEGRPDTWKTLFWGRGGAYWGEYPVSAIGFLVGLAECNLGDPNFDEAETNPFRMNGAPSFQPVNA